MKVLFVGYPKCSTCKKATKFLEQENVEYEYRDIKENNPTYKELKEWHKKSGLDIKKFFNTSGQIYREMNLKDKLEDMSEDQKLKLLSKDGMLVKRPILIVGDKVTTGFKEDFWKEFIS